MAQGVVEERKSFEPHAATEEGIQRALQQETKDNRLKNVGRLILKVLMLPVLFVAFALKWIGTFCVRISAWIFNLAAGLMAIVAVVYLAQGDIRNAMIGFIVGAVIFLIPTIATFMVAIMGTMQKHLHEFIWN